jgi:hypothetical protein
MKNNSEPKMHELIEIGLQGHPLENLLDGWTFRIEESSSNIYVVEGTNRQGKRTSSFGIDPEKVLDDCIKKANQLDSRQRIFTKFLNLFSK